MLPKNYHRRFNYKSGHALKVTKLAMNPLICSYCHTGHWLQEHSNKISIIRQLLVQTKHLMTAVWIQSSAILFTTELNKLFQKRQKNCHSQLQNKHFNNSSFVSQSSDSFVPKLRRYRCEKPEAASLDLLFCTLLHT